MCTIFFLKEESEEVILGEKSHLAFLFESVSIMSSSPAVTFHQPTCQAHSVQCAAKDSFSCVSVCVLRALSLCLCS